MRIDEFRGVTSRSVRAGIAGLLAAAGVLAGGCSDGTPKGSATLTPGEFRSTDADVAPPTTTPTVKTTTPSEAAAGFLDLTSLPGAPSTTSPAVALTGEEVIVDQFIGQVNGRAIMASEFFGDGFGERLRAMGRDEKYAKNPRAWNQEAERAIYQRLLVKVQNGLLLDEVYASMTPEVKQQGIRYFMEKVRGELVRSNEGSAQLANERLMSQEGKTLDQVMDDKRDRALMGSLLDTKVDARVNVSWQQVVNEWQRRYERYKDQRIANFVVVAAPADDATAVAEIQDGLAGGKSVKDLGASPRNQFASKKGGAHVVAYKGELTSAKVFGPAVLDEAARKLEPGQSVGPIKANGGLWWIALDSIEAPGSKSLYDAQLEILQELRAAKTNQERNVYIGRLMEKSSRTPMGQMMEQLNAIAKDRYAPRWKQ